MISVIVGVYNRQVINYINTIRRGFLWLVLTGTPMKNKITIYHLGIPTSRQWGLIFQKECEKDFTMNAPGCTLTLEVTDSSDIQ